MSNSARHKEKQRARARKIRSMKNKETSAKRATIIRNNEISVAQYFRRIGVIMKREGVNNGNLH